MQTPPPSPVGEAAASQEKRLHELAKLQRKRERLRESIAKEDTKEAARFAKTTWGQGMRHSKLPNSSKRSDELEYQMRRLERQIDNLLKMPA